MSLYPELDNRSFEELAAFFGAPPLDGEEYAYTYYSEVTLRLRQTGDEGTAFLWHNIDRVDSDRLRAILFALSLLPGNIREIQPLAEHELDDLRKRLIAFLKDKRPEIVAEAIEGLSRLREKGVRDDIITLRDHPDPYIRGAVLRFMTRVFPEQAFSLLLNALGDSHFIVRETAVDELDDLGNVESLPHIAPLMNDPHPDVQQAARTAVEHLTDDTA